MDKEIEKAKLYDEALEIAKKNYISAQDLCEGSKIGVECFKNTLESIFPELKESEDDRIRKELTEFLKSAAGGFLDTTIHCKTFGKWVDWLEKQLKKEFVNFDEAEKEKTEFIGDGFIECHADFLDFKKGETYWLEYIGDDMYNVRSDNLLGKTYHITPCQLYTIFKKLTWPEKQGEQKTKINSCKITFEDVLALECAMKTVKITKGGNELYEMLVLLYNKIHNIYLLKKQGKQEPVWSEEDVFKVQRICKYLNEAKKYYADITEVRECIDWLKSLEDRYTWKPNDEQMEALAWALSLSKNCGEECAFDLRTLQDQLKKLRNE